MSLLAIMNNICATRVKYCGAIMFLVAHNHREHIDCTVELKY